MKINSNKTKEHILRFRAVDYDRFLEVKIGKKKIETRAATELYKKFAKGDILVFVCGKEKIKKKIMSVGHFKSIPALFKKHGIKNVMPDVDTIGEARKRYYSYPDYKEKIKKLGLLAFKLK